MERKIWANSGDSHFLEPADLFEKTLPPALAERMPRSVKSESGDRETVYIDGVEMAWEDLKPSDLLTAEAFENAS